MIGLQREELIAINAILDNQPIYGLSLIEPDIPENKRVEQVMKSLERKELIKGTSLTDKGLIVTRMLEEYKKSSRHVFINRLRVALIDKEYVIVIEKRGEDEYILNRTLKVTLEKKLILSAPFIQKETKRRFIPFIKEKVDLEVLERELDTSKWTDIMVIQKHEEKHMYMHMLYYMDLDEAYRYDYIHHERIEKTSQEIRQDLMEILEIGENKYA